VDDQGTHFVSLVIPRAFWKYCQAEGSLWTPQGKKLAVGFSGHDVGLNNPSLQNAVNVGPIPQGVWMIASQPEGPSHLGPVALALTPVFGTTTFGRSGFFLHGDSLEDVLDHTKDASHGCVVFPRAVREAVLASPVKELVVVENEDTSP
jgi:hypothetical protein